MRYVLILLLLPAFSLAQSWEELNAKMEDYNSKGDFVNALDYAQQAKVKAETDFGKADERYLEAINNLGFLYVYTGNFVKAEPLMNEVIDILKKTTGENTSDYASALNSLGRLYQETGNYPKAEPLYLNALELKKKILGDTSVEYASTMNDLALLYDALGDYQQAQPMLEKLVVILKKALGENDPIYGQSLNNLATLYYKTEKYKEAEELYLKAMEIKRKQGEGHPDYVMSVNNLAVLYKKQKDFGKSEKLFQQSLELRKKSPGERSNSYAEALNNLGTLYDDMKEYGKAEPLFGQALKLQEEITSVNHANYATYSNNLAKMYARMGSLEKAEPWFYKAVDGSYYKIREQFSFLSEKEKELFLKTIAYRFDDFSVYALKRKADNPAITGAVYNNLLKTKGILLKSATAMRNAISEMNDPQLTESYNSWVELKKKINSLSSIPVHKRTEDLTKLEKQANDLEGELVKKSAAMSELETFSGTTWKNVQEDLAKNEAAIEFTSFKIGKDSVLYCALIVKKNNKQPLMIPVFEEKQLAAVLGKSQANDFNYINAIYGSGKNPTTELYNLIWKPLESSLKGVKKVNVSPAGLLHKVSFASLSKGSGNYLINDVALNILTTTAFTGSSSSVVLDQNSKVTLFGGVQYSLHVEEEATWSYLAGTRREAEGLEKLFIAQGINTVIYKDTSATELQLKNSATGSTILHIATHGFFFPDPEEMKGVKATATVDNKDKIVFRGGGRGVAGVIVYNKDPLMRSGLAMAGANDSWNSETKGEDNNGILSAAELAQLDLRKNKLMVLSACETGLGDIKVGEGVYGLQRALKMAGSKFIVMSLWQVPDAETSEFMGLFYSKLLKSKNVRNAFSEAQLEMSKKLDPYFWAAFVLIE